MHEEHRRIRIARRKGLHGGHVGEHTRKGMREFIGSARWCSKVGGGPTGYQQCTGWDVSPGLDVNRQTQFISKVRRLRGDSDTRVKSSLTIIYYKITKKNYIYKFLTGHLQYFIAKNVSLHIYIPVQTNTLFMQSFSFFNKVM